MRHPLKADAAFILNRYDIAVRAKSRGQSRSMLFLFIFPGLSRETADIR